MYQSTYYVDRSTDTFADVLLAHGLACLLSQLLQDNVGSGQVRIRDVGHAYAITTSAPIEEGFEQVAWFCDMPFIETRSQKPPEGWSGQVVDYERERDRRSQYFEARRNLPKEALRSGATVDQYPELAVLESLKPRQDWDILAQINQMSAIVAYHQVLGNWLACRDCFSELLRLILALYAETPNREAEALEAWKTLAKRQGLAAKDTTTPVQVLNPGMGKGINRPKPDGAHRLGNPDAFWIGEFLKFWGMRYAGLPRIVRSVQGGGRGPRDRKTYVLRPRDISLSTLKRVYEAFNSGMWASTAIKMDVLAALRYTQVYLEQWRDGQIVDARYGDQPNDYVAGISIAFYKDLGSAVALLNLAEMALPGWMRVDSAQAGNAYLDFLEEHRRVAESLEERNADQYRLLQRYRDFISAGDLEAFFDFAAGYANLTMQRLDRGQWAPRLQTDHMEVLIMGHDVKLGPILRSPGFQHVATAIRRSTVIPQSFKARGKRGPYDIRYGLGTELLRYATYPDQFVQALSRFVHEYNQETSQVNERYNGKPPVRRAMITTEDLAEVATLIDEYGSKTVANLLVAFGYGREPREKDLGVDQAQPEQEPDSQE